MFSTHRTARLCVPALVLSALVAAPTFAQAPVAAGVAASNKAALVESVQQSHVTDIWPSKLVATFNFKLSAIAWKAMMSKDGVNTMGRVARGVGQYAKDQEIGDLEKVETSNNNDRSSRQAEVDELIAQVKPKITLSFEATQPKLSAAQSRLLLNYVSFVGQFVNRAGWTPRGGRANLKLILSSSAKDVSVKASKDATNFSIIAPIKEPIDWSGKIEKALNRYKK